VIITSYFVRQGFLTNLFSNGPGTTLGNPIIRIKTCQVEPFGFVISGRVKKGGKP
jgi:hypothetical protein